MRSEDAELPLLLITYPMEQLGMPRIEVYEGSQKIAEVGLPEKKFSTGSVGYWASTKMEFNGKRYQCQFQLVEIGSKPNAS